MLCFSSLPFIFFSTRMTYIHTHFLLQFDDEDDDDDDYILCYPHPLNLKWNLFPSLFPNVFYTHHNDEYFCHICLVSCLPWRREEMNFEWNEMTFDIWIMNLINGSDERYRENGLIGNTPIIYPNTRHHQLSQRKETNEGMKQMKDRWNDILMKETRKYHTIPYQMLSSPTTLTKQTKHDKHRLTVTSLLAIVIYVVITMSPLTPPICVSPWQCHHSQNDNVDDWIVINTDMREKQHALPVSPHIHPAFLTFLVKNGTR